MFLYYLDLFSEQKKKKKNILINYLFHISPCLSLKFHWHIFGTLIPFLTLPCSFPPIVNLSLPLPFVSFFSELFPECLNFSLFLIHHPIPSNLLELLQYQLKCSLKFCYYFLLIHYPYGSRTDLFKI